MIWRCPFCGGKDIEAVAQQTWAVEIIVDDGHEVAREPYEPVGGITVTHVLCLNCNAEDTSEKDWHMSDREWEAELKAREGDYLYDSWVDDGGLIE